MKSEKFLQMLGGIDSDLVENAKKDIDIWQESKEGVSVMPAPQKARRKMVITSAACAAAVICGAFALTANLGNMRGNYLSGAASEKSEAADGLNENEAADSTNESEAADSTAESDPEQSENGVTLWQGASLPRITTEIMCWDDDLVYDVLADNYPFYKEQRADQFYPNLTVTLWSMVGEDGVDRLYLDNAPSRIYYHSTDNLDYLTFFNFHDARYNNPNLKYSDVLDGFTKENAIQRAKETAEKFGITNLGTPEVFALKAEDANAYSEYCIKKFGRDELKEGPYVPWTKDDEAYFIKFPLMFGETPLVSNQTAVYKTTMAHDSRTSFLAAEVRVIVTKDKIVAFDAKEIFKPEYTVGESVNINFSKDDIIKKAIAENRHNDPSGVETVYSCELVYTPVEATATGFVFAPAWQVNYGTNFNYDDSETGETVWGGEVHRTVVYNAETGEFIDMYPEWIGEIEEEG